MKRNNNTYIKAKLHGKAMFSDLFQQTGTSQHQCIGCQGMIKNVLALGNVFSVHGEAFQCVLRVSTFHRVLRIIQPLTQCFQLCQLHRESQISLRTIIRVAMPTTRRRRGRGRSRRQPRDDGEGKEIGIKRGFGSTTSARLRSHRIGQTEEILVLDPSRFSQSLSSFGLQRSFSFFSFLFSCLYVMRERQKPFNK